MYLQELFLLTQCLMGILMLICLQKITRLKKQIDLITKEVKQYLAFLEEDMEEEHFPQKREGSEKISKDEAESHLIQAVLTEFFP